MALAGPMGRERASSHGLPPTGPPPRVPAPQDIARLEAQIKELTSKNGDLEEQLRVMREDKNTLVRPTARRPGGRPRLPPAPPTAPSPPTPPRPPAAAEPPPAPRRSARRWP